MGLSVLAGGPTATSVTFVAFSDIAGNVTIAVEPGNRAIVIDGMTVCGDDHTDGVSFVGYVGNSTLTGLTPFTSYTYTATNGAEVVSGSFYTAPVQNGGAKYSVGFTTCFYPHPDAASVFDFLNWYRLTETEYPLIAHVHPDDWGYPDHVGILRTVEGTVWDADAPVSVANSRMSEYNYCLSYAATMGGFTMSGGGDVLSASNFQDYIHNVCLLVQAGDHEYFNNIWSSDDINTRPNPMHKSAGASYDGPARVAWNLFCKPLCGTLFASANPNSHHWELDLGDLQIIALDCVSNVAWSVGITSALGQDQILEVLNKVNNTKPFKLIANPAWAVRTAYNASAVYKVEQELQSEIDRFVLDDGTAGLPYSLMRNPNTNGTVGAFAFLRGDSHYAPVHKFGGPPSGQNLAESFYELGLLGANAGKGGTLGAPGPRSSYDGDAALTNVEIVGGVFTPGSKHQACVIAQVDGTTNPPTMKLMRIDYGWPDGTGMPPGFTVDSSLAVETNIGPNGAYMKTFERIFSGYQATNLGVASVSDIHPIGLANGHSDGIAD